MRQIFVRGRGSSAYAIIREAILPVEHVERYVKKYGLDKCRYFMRIHPYSDSDTRISGYLDVRFRFHSNNSHSHSW